MLYVVNPAEGINKFYNLLGLLGNNISHVCKYCYSFRKYNIHEKSRHRAISIALHKGNYYTVHFHMKGSKSANTDLDFDCTSILDFSLVVAPRGSIDASV